MAMPRANNILMKLRPDVFGVWLRITFPICPVLFTGVLLGDSRVISHCCQCKLRYRWTNSNENNWVAALQPRCRAAYNRRPDLTCIVINWRLYGMPRLILPNAILCVFFVTHVSQTRYIVITLL